MGCSGVFFFFFSLSPFLFVIIQGIQKSKNWLGEIYPVVPVPLV